MAWDTFLALLPGASRFPPEILGRSWRLHLLPTATDQRHARLRRWWSRSLFPTRHEDDVSDLFLVPLNSAPVVAAAAPGQPAASILSGPMADCSTAQMQILIGREFRLFSISTPVMCVLH